ncbi:MAG: hypothetical protein O4803_09615 [Trichodesmium sp. St15_bin1_1]|nr:hypothetical protein [Trichodesmium sp. St5_bin2_1]MDE5114492.1 hypothetical protein [Trichodesmium sp. St15_bin1_1]
MKRQPASELRLGCFPVPNDRGGRQQKLRIKKTRIIWSINVPLSPIDWPSIHLTP